MKLFTIALVSTLAVAPLAATAQNGGGFRVGLEAGIEDGAENATDNNEIYGVFGGYDFDFGNAVAGIELGYSRRDLNATGGLTLEDTLQLKGRYGWKFGEGLAYGTAGLAWSEDSGGDTNNGYVLGLGYEYSLNETTFVGAEYLYSQYQDVGPANLDVSSNSVAVKLGFRF